MRGSTNHTPIDRIGAGSSPSAGGFCGEGRWRRALVGQSRVHTEGAAASQRDLRSGYWKRALTRLLIMGGRTVRAGWWRRMARVPWGPREIGEEAELVADGCTEKRRLHQWQKSVIISEHRGLIWCARVLASQSTPPFFFFFLID
jgi:hypothetical protein